MSFCIAWIWSLVIITAIIGELSSILPVWWYTTSCGFRINVIKTVTWNLWLGLMFLLSHHFALYVKLKTLAWRNKEWLELVFVHLVAYEFWMLATRIAVSSFLVGNSHLQSVPIEIIGDGVLWFVWFVMWFQDVTHTLWGKCRRLVIVWALPLISTRSIMMRLRWQLISRFTHLIYCLINLTEALNSALTVLFQNILNSMQIIAKLN